MYRKLAFFLALFIFVGSSEVLAQDYFGQNKLNYEKLDKYAQTDHFMVYHSLDLNDPFQLKHFEDQVLKPLEQSYHFYSSTFNHTLKVKIPVMVFKSHSGFEGNYVIDSPFYKYCDLRKKIWQEIVGTEASISFLPEGVGAFAEPTRNRIVLKLDFLPPLNATIIAHELGHIFQFDMLSSGLIGRLLNMIQLPSWFIEGGADYWADKFNPYTRDDIRRMQQRIAAGNPEKYLPTWAELNSDSSDAYSMGAMVFEFIEHEFGEDVVRDFYLTRLTGKQRGNLLQVLGDAISKKNNKTQSATTAPQQTGKNQNPKSKLTLSSSTFDRLHREYWAKKFAADSRARPTPYSDNLNFKSWSLVPDDFPYPIVSAVTSCDAKRTFGLSVNKNNVTVIEIKARENPDQILTDSTERLITNITPYNPPDPVEYIVAQELNVWPFNGSDLAISCDGKMIAVFGRVGRDHSLTLWDVEKKNMIESIELSLDQAFSPYFSKDGKKVYFSASKNVTRNVYVVDLETKEVKNITGNGGAEDFDTAPAVSNDGTRLAYIHFDGEFQKLFIKDLVTGNKEQLTFGRFNDNSPSWSEDDKTIIYTSDEDAGIWNIYALDMETRQVSQWTNFFGGAFTPRFVPGNSKQVIYIANWHYDQYGSFIYPNFEVFKADLRKPIKVGPVSAPERNMDFSFRIDDLFRIKADKNQILNDRKPPDNFRLYGRNVTFGYSPYFGGLGGATIALSNILENKHYFFRTLYYGSFKILDGAYLNQENRLNWGYTVYHQEMPLRYGYWQFSGLSGGKYPDQIVLNQTWTKQSGVDFFASYPLNKFKRLEGSIKFKRKSFINEFGLTRENMPEDILQYLSPIDLELFNLFESSNGSSIGFVGAYVVDTGVDSSWGPINGNKLRAQVEFAPSVNGFLGYTTVSVDTRRYFCLGQCTDSLFAVRGKGSWSSSPTSGDIGLNEIDQIRGYPYGRFVGNQFVYGNAELRFPVAEFNIIGLGYIPVRAIIFGDIGYSRFSKQNFPSQSGKSVGTVFQLPFMGVPLNYGFSWTDMDGFKDKKTFTYVGFGW